MVLIVEYVNLLFNINNTHKHSNQDQQQCDQLFELSAEQLTEDQRSDILRAMDQKSTREGTGNIFFHHYEEKSASSAKSKQMHPCDGTPNPIKAPTDEAIERAPSFVR